MRCGNRESVDFDFFAKPPLDKDALRRVLPVASPTDLLAHKLQVILQRAESRDYSDIAALLDYGVPLHVGLAGARRLFGRQFQPAESLKALTYFGDGDLASVGPATRTLLKTAVDRVQGHLRHVFENTTVQQPQIFAQREQDPHLGL